MVLSSDDFRTRNFCRVCFFSLAAAGTIGEDGKQYGDTQLHRRVLLIHYTVSFLENICFIGEKLAGINHMK